MIHFFRKIRQQLLSDNRVPKYVLYAIGEIVLVVLGILIALSINNANDLAKLRKKEFALLTEMSENLRIDLRDLDFNIEGNNQRIRANKIILKTLQERKPMNDTLKPYYGGIFGNYQLSENTAAWATLQSVGLDLVSNDSLRNAISHLYMVEYGYLDNLEKGIDDRYQWETLYPQILALINVDRLWVSAEPIDHEALMDNRKFQETLKMNLFLRNYLQNQYTTIRAHVSALRDQILKHAQTLDDA